MKTINEFIQSEFNGDACDFYRTLVAWMNDRAEFMNQDKGFTRLAKEYIQFYLEH